MYTEIGLLGGDLIVVQEIAVNLINLRVVFKLPSVEVCCILYIVFEYEDPFLTSEKSHKPLHILIIILFNLIT
jgi:hypothetical protein